MHPAHDEHDTSCDKDTPSKDVEQFVDVDQEEDDTFEDELDEPDAEPSGFVRQQTEYSWPTYAVAPDPVTVSTPAWAMPVGYDVSSAAAMLIGGHQCIGGQFPAKVMVPAPTTAMLMQNFQDKQNRNRRKARSLIGRAQRALQKQQIHQLQVSAAAAAVMACSPEAGGMDCAAQLTARFCPYCGGQCRPHFKFCQFCGSNMAQQ
jgi:hypothetical protein